MPGADLERVEEVFLEALKKPAPERERFVREACGDDSEFREEVFSLLEHHGDRSILTTDRASEAGEGSGPHPLRRKAGTTTVPSMLRRYLGARGLRRATVLLAALALFLLGLWTRNRIEDAVLEIRAAELATVLEADVARLEDWIESLELRARGWARDERVIAWVEQLQKDLEEGGVDALRASSAQAELAALLALEMLETESTGTGVLGLDGLVLNNINPSDFSSVSGVGERIVGLGQPYVAAWAAGETRFWGPLRQSDFMQPEGETQGTMYCGVGTPVLDETGSPIAILTLGYSAWEGQFSRSFAAGRLGETGESFAFDDRGLLLSESRFTEQLRSAGVLPRIEDGQGTWDSRAQLNLHVRDPGGDLTEGHRSDGPLDAQPLTRMARLALASRDDSVEEQSGLLLEPYRSYHGAEVIGAWLWLPERGFGVASEMAVSEAFAPLRALNITAGVLLLLLVGATGATLSSSFSVMRLRRRLDSLDKLGQYTLGRKIGEGGMGRVYLAEHALLKRPTAVKILTPGTESANSVARFEREVQLASQLGHPNTIEIFDYGQTDEGVFFYAMEFVDGLDLSELVRRYGAIPAARVVHLLRQIAGSLAEAHEQGLIHRDIKPQNIMVCSRGGVHDLVKVLDFGLAKPLAPDASRELTEWRQIGGTPMYMAPERFTHPKRVDARADVYSFGAVAYYLLTGTPLFRFEDDAHLLHQVLHVQPVRPSEIVSAIPEALEGLVLDCLEKAIGGRPADAGSVQQRLEGLEVEEWGQSDAALWWERAKAARTA